MTHSTCEILIVGGGVGGCAAALAACEMGRTVILTEETDWIGGQFTSQAVPPDEHPWIEQMGCTRRYRAFRNGVREHYRRNRNLAPEAMADLFLNPGNGWVSKLCFEPKVGLAVLESMLQPHVSAGRLRIWRRTHAVDVETHGDVVQAVTLRDMLSGGDIRVEAKYVLDATETGSVLPLRGVEYRIGAEARAEFGEPHAPEFANPEDVQGFTWCLLMGNDLGVDHVIPRPEGYSRWRSYRPRGWPGPMLDFTYPNPITLERRRLPLFGSQDQPGWFDYRRIVDHRTFAEPVQDATVVNWPQNDYFEGGLLDVPESERAKALAEARQLSLSLLYWLQTEAPRPDGGAGYPGLCLRPDLSGTEDGLAMAPYIREARRIRAHFTVTELDVSADCHKGARMAPSFADSVGIGAYRLDLHPSVSGTGYVDISTLPFEIPMGALIPVRMRNVLAAGKCLGVTHLANGCYRLHPVEWNIGEAAGALAAHCVSLKREPHEIRGSKESLASFQERLRVQGVPLHWQDELDSLPADTALDRPLGAL